MTDKTDAEITKLREDSDRLHWLLSQRFEVWKSIGWELRMLEDTPSRRLDEIDALRRAGDCC